MSVVGKEIENNCEKLWPTKVLSWIQAISREAILIYMTSYYIINWIQWSANTIHGTDLCKRIISTALSNPESFFHIIFNEIKMCTIIWICNRQFAGFAFVWFWIHEINGWTPLPIAILTGKSEMGGKPEAPSAPLTAEQTSIFKVISHTHDMRQAYFVGTP